jgi:uncharacterized membrane protein YqgA involved in biofilm formation
MSTGNKILRSRLGAIQDALGHNNVAQVQKAHLDFLNAIIMAQQD